MHPPQDPIHPPSESPYGVPNSVTNPHHLKPNYKLYGLQAVGIATFLGAFMGGAWVMAKNAKRLGGGAFGWLLLLGGAAANWALFYAINTIPFVSKLPSLLLFIPQLLIMSVLFTALQKDSFNHHVESGGEEGSSWAALGVGLMAAFVSVLIAVGVFSQQNDLFNLSYNTRRYDQNNAIHYSDEVDIETVKLLREVFRREGLFTKDGEVEVRVTRAGERYVLAIPFNGEAWSDPAVEKEARRLAAGIGGTMLGYPFTINLCDDAWNVKKPIVVTEMSPGGMPDFKAVIDVTGF